MSLSIPQPACLDELIARYGVRRGRERGMQPGVATGHAALDACLPGGGLPRSALTELLAQPAGSGELALLLPLLADCTRAGRRVAFVEPPYPPYPPYAPALAGAGLALDRVVVVNADGGPANLWAAEQLLRSPLFGAVVCWSAVTSKAVRRLQVAAETGGGVGVLIQPAQAGARASMAALRLAVTPVAGGVEVRVIKCRGPAGARVRCALPGAAGWSYGNADEAIQTPPPITDTARLSLADG